MSDLKNRVAIIGGSSKGLGKGCAVSLAQKGASIVLCARNEKQLHATAEEISALGVEVLPLVVDMSKAVDNERVIKETLKKFGRIDILVNNSGGPKPGNFKDFSEEDWNEAFQSVLMYVIRLTRDAIPEMKKNNWGRVINITSLSVKEPSETLVLSNVFRAGVVAFSKSISKELIKSNITINNICPGAFMTDRATELIRKAAEASGKTFSEIEAANREKLPLGRYQTPNELGAFVAFLCSEEASGFTGTTVQLDAGISNGLL